MHNHKLFNLIHNFFIGQFMFFEGGGGGNQGYQKSQEAAAAQKKFNKMSGNVFQEKEAQIQKRTSDLERQLQLEKEVAGSRSRDIKAGSKFAREEILGEEGLGRAGEDADIQDTLQRLDAVSREGLSRKEVEAERAEAFQGINRNTQTASRRLQSLLAGRGVKGATAGNQLAGVEIAGAAEKNTAERQFFLQSEQIKRQGLSKFATAQSAVKSFDIGQAAREKDIILQTSLGFAGLGSAERSADSAGQASIQAARAVASAGAGGGDKK